MKIDQRWLTAFFWVGMVIVAGSHIYMLAVGLPQEQFTAHAILNLFAAALFGIAWFQRK